MTSSDGLPGGSPISAVVRDRYVVVRDPGHLIAPDGSLLLDLATEDPGEPTERRIAWLR